MDDQNKKYKSIRLLGRGAFGQAYLVKCLDEESLCVKKIVNLKIISEEAREYALKEASILKTLNHPNIVRFREVYKTRQDKLCIIMDYADGGDLSNKLKQGQPLNERQILDWFTQICQAIKHVHDNKIIHRDLKPQNIFLTKDGKIKLGDFGIARVLNETLEQCQTNAGTPAYQSPEIIQGGDYSFKTDIWSLGVILYELCALELPFKSNNMFVLGKKITVGKYSPLPNRYSTQILELVQSLLQVDQAKRPSIHDILELPIFASRIKRAISEATRNNQFQYNHTQQVKNDNKIKRQLSQPNSKYWGLNGMVRRNQEVRNKVQEPQQQTAPYYQDQRQKQQEFCFPSYQQTQIYKSPLPSCQFDQFVKQPLQQQRYISSQQIQTQYKSQSYQQQEICYNPIQILRPQVNNYELIYRPTPVCLSCQRPLQIKKKYQIGCYALSWTLFILIIFPLFFWIPLTTDNCKDTIKVCANCEQEII